jgi:hypothetical protein
MAYPGENMMKTLARSLRFIRDLFFPLPDPLSPTYIEEREATLATSKAAVPTDKEGLEKYKTTFDSFLEGEEKRRQSVESRLTTIMGLASIAGSIVFGTILAQMLGTLRISSNALRWGIALGSLYLVMQISSAILAAVRGLSRRTYTTPTPSDFLKQDNPNETVNFRALVVKHVEALANQQDENNRKVTLMAVAHRAIVQFVCGLLMVALIGTYFATQPPATPDDLTQTLKKNHELQELLRGPTGPTGPRGPTGDPGKVIRTPAPCSTKNELKGSS